MIIFENMELIKSVLVIIVNVLGVDKLKIEEVVEVVKFGCLILKVLNFEVMFNLIVNN